MSEFKDYILGNYDAQELCEIATHGCAAGTSEFIYYHEAVSSYEEHESDIWDRLYEESEIFGYENVLQFIASFAGCKDVGDADQFKNLLVWWFVESVAQEFLREQEYRESDNEIAE